MNRKFEQDLTAKLRAQVLRLPRMTAFAGVAALATLAITAAAALPSRSPPAAEASQPVPPPTATQFLSANSVPASDNDSSARRFAGRVGQNLTDSLLRAGVPEALGREYVGVLAKAIPLSVGLSVEDRFDLVVERLPDGQLGRLLYVGLDRVGRSDLELLKWTDGRSTVWVNADQASNASSPGMRKPVAGRVSSGFGERFHPILGYMRFHKGVDLAAAFGSPVVAAADGRVISAGWRGGYGRSVAILHQGNIETLYGHMSRLTAAAGSFVHQGDLIGYVGSSGLSTGPHLHYEVLKNGRPVNPLSVSVDGQALLTGEKLHQFNDRLRHLMELPSPRPS